MVSIYPESKEYGSVVEWNISRDPEYIRVWFLDSGGILVNVHVMTSCLTRNNRDFTLAAGLREQ